MRRIEIRVRAVWDDEAKVYVAESDDVLGLVTEAETLDMLRDKVFAMIPELLRLNHSAENELPEIPVHFMAEHVAKIKNPLYR